ncbi:MAG: hypothetical protein DRP87_02695 [Spirochaetes bacterium]|nr:MAG: hypothetical protein DRP87_02695 [Spirochaetota bacterium]
MNCKEMKLKIQALTDNELEEKEIHEVLNHLESCYRCREDYISLLQLQKKMKNIAIPEPQKEWFEDLPHRVLRRSGALLGKVLFLGSYILLLGYALYSLFRSKNEEIIIKFAVGGVVLGGLILLIVSLADRIRESRSDKYKGVLK